MTVHYVRDTVTGRLLRADDGRVFKAIDRSVAEAVIEKLRRDGADVSSLEVYTVAPPPQTGRDI